MTSDELFQKQKIENIRRQGQDKRAIELATQFIACTSPYQYSYNFSWMGRPIIQFPQDMLAMQEILWQIKPDLVVETGIAYGGSLIYYASILELIGKGHVLGIDIDIRAHNREGIEKHPMSKRITMIEGSSTTPEIVDQVRAYAGACETVLVALDSNHTHEHVLKELELYSPLVTPGSFLIVFDTLIEDMPENFFSDRPWGRGNNPKTAVNVFLESHREFSIRHDIDSKLLISVARGGYLWRSDGTTTTR